MTNILFHVLAYRDETVEAIEGSNSNENGGGEGTEDVDVLAEAARSALCSGIRTNCFACVVSDDEEQEEIHQSNPNHDDKKQEEVDNSSKPFAWKTGERKKNKKKKEEEKKQIYKVVLGLAHLGETHSKPRHWRSNPSLSNPPNHLHGELVAAGWPSWLSAVAGGALYGWVPRQPDTFKNLTKIGKGRRSYVYKARDTLTGKTVALKKVRFNNLKPESVKLLVREILVLRRLAHPNVIKLEGLVTWKMSSSLYLVFEYMEHDLSGLAEDPGIKFTEPQVKCYMHQLLLGLEYCHSHGVLHRDINGSNLLIDNGGILKIAGFGSASFFDPNCKLPMTSCVTTLWYRPPELLMGASDYGVGVDLWSLGCVLAELLTGKPIMPGQKEMEQLHMIFKLCGSPSEKYRKKSKLLLAHVFKPVYKRCIRETFKDFIPSSLPLIEALLAIDPVERQTATVALRSEFFTTEPYACEPSSLPKYPSKKCMDAKRDKKTRLPSNGGQRSGGKSNDGLKETRPLDRAVKTLCHSEAADIEIQLLVK